MHKKYTDGAIGNGKEIVTFSIFIVTLSIHKSAFLCYNKFAKQKICGFLRPTHMRGNFSVRAAEMITRNAALRT